MDEKLGKELDDLANEFGGEWGVVPPDVKRAIRHDLLSELRAWAKENKLRGRLPFDAIPLDDLLTFLDEEEK